MLIWRIRCILYEEIDCFCRFTDSFFFVQDERATGYGVALLTTLFGKFTKQPLLHAIAPDLEVSRGVASKKSRVN